MILLYAWLISIFVRLKERHQLTPSRVSAVRTLRNIPPVMHLYINVVAMACALGTVEGFGVIGGSRGATGLVSGVSSTRGRAWHNSNKISFTRPSRHSRCVCVFVCCVSAESGMGLSQRKDPMMMCARRKRRYIHRYSFPGVWGRC